jgi:hypothetical protein
MNDRQVPRHQEFPTSGILQGNMNRELPGLGTVCPETHMPEVPRPGIPSEIPDDEADENYCLTSSISRGRSDPVFAYVLTSLEVLNGNILHTGCGPNMHGECITLCTCMHYHRTWRKTWRGIWVAGFTGTQYGNKLFYLMQVGEEASSHFELWNSGFLPNRDAKSVTVNSFGDVYKPKGTASQGTIYNINFYESPIANHVHGNAWGSDIYYKFPLLKKKQPKLLVGIPARSYLWSRPMYSHKRLLHPRFKFYPSLVDFYNILK